MQIKITFSKILFFNPVLFGIIFLLFYYNQNITQVTITDLFFVFSIFLPCITLFSLIMRIIIRDNTKSFLISSLITILFLTYIPIHSIIFDSQIKENETSSHIILFSSMLIVLAGTIFFLIKSKKNLENILKISFVIALSLIVFNIIDIGYSSTKTDLFTDNSVEVFSVDRGNLRNIYHIILDEHASTAVLKQYFNYDNSNFENFLKKRGFFIPEFSFSNYNMTGLSIPSILNMGYIDSKWKSEKEFNNLLNEMMMENSVAKNFERIGYKVISFHNEYHLEPSKNAITLCDNDVRSTRLLIFYLDNTAYKIFKNMIFATFDQILNTGQGNASFQPVIENRVCVLNELLNVRENFSQPIFVHAHLIMPHSPFIFDSNGNVINTRNMSDDQNPSAYLAQLQYTDTKIQEIIDQLLDSEPKPIIIIQSDHGIRFALNESDDPRKHEFLNFEAFYFPDDELDSDEYPVITPVNSFRILFNKYFGTNYELLEDKAFLIEGSKFSDVTDFVISNSMG